MQLKNKKNQFKMKLLEKTKETIAVIIFVLFIICLIMFFKMAMEKPRVSCDFDNKTNICTCFIENRPSQANGWEGYTYETCMEMNNES